MTNKKKLYYAVIGDPVEHSRSPEIYAPMFKKFNIDADFLRIRVKKVELFSIRETIKEYDLSGFAVTMPHKRAILPYLDALDKSAEKAGSVNIVTIDQGALIGHNTDGAGLVEALKKSGIDVHNKRVVILGRGGAAQSASSALTDRGAKVLLLSRRHEPIGVQSIEAAIAEIEASSHGISSADIIINATPLGMSGGTDFNDLGFINTLRRDAVVFDMVYRPGGDKTSLIKSAERRGLTCLGGEELLYHQGVLAFELWTGFRYGNSAVR